MVIGAGPGGYVGRHPRGPARSDVACVEKEPRARRHLPARRLHPSKALLESSEQFAEARDGLAAHGVKVADVRAGPAAHARAQGRASSQQLTDGVAGLFKKNKVTRYPGDGAPGTAPGRVVVEGDEP